ncbi:uncharacterized protein LOC113791200, partial [Dermatophagoides pteronyssinus]|uniref:uncharacterized protein LOC113791200 n=1 Tax=Dermatophagoides pteronyssinus TaxID=6956 RepID=UPI003F676D87
MAQSESSESLPSSSSSSNSHDTSVKSLQCNNRKQFTLPSIILPPSPTTNMLGKNRSDLNNHHQRKNHPIKSLSTFKFQPIPIKPTYEQIYDCIITENLIQLKKFILDSYGNQIYSWLNSNIVQISMNVKQFIESIPSIQENITMLNNAIQTSSDDDNNESTFKYLKSMMEQQPELFFNRNEFGITPLHRCVCKQRYDFVEFIVNALPDTLDACDYQGRTPLHMAALLNDSGQMYCRLVDLGAKTYVTDMFLRRPEDYLKSDDYQPKTFVNNQNNQNQQQHRKPKQQRKSNRQQQRRRNKSISPNIYQQQQNNTLSTTNHHQHYHRSSIEIDVDFCSSCNNVDDDNDSKNVIINTNQPINNHLLKSGKQQRQSTTTAKTTLKLPILKNQHYDNDDDNPDFQPNNQQICLTNSMNNNCRMKINIKEIIRNGNLNELEELVLNGYGYKLLNEITNTNTTTTISSSSSSSAPLIQEFFNNLPNYLYQIDQLHQASQRGNIDEFQYLLDRYSLICSRDRLGATPLHKAVLFGHYDLIKFIIKNFDQNILYIGDNEKRTPLHYAAGLVDDENHSIYYLLLKYGPKASIIVDKKNHTADHYLRSPNELNILNLRKHSKRLNINHTINLANKLKLLSSSSPSSPSASALSLTLSPSTSPLPLLK